MSQSPPTTPADLSPDAAAAVPAEMQEQVNPQIEQMETSTRATETVLPAADELAEPSSDVEELQKEVKDLNEQVLRRAAEFRNYRRRTEAELGQTARRGREEVIMALLGVFDDLRRSLGAAGQAAQAEETGPAFDALNDGVQLVFKKFTDALVSFGVEPIESVGQPFDEELHDAMMQQPAPDPETPSGTVLAEIQPGYRIGDRILRHAQVVVAE